MERGEVGSCCVDNQVPLAMDAFCSLGVHAVSMPVEDHLPQTTEVLPVTVVLADDTHLV